MHIHVIGDRFFNDELIELTLTSARELNCTVSKSKWQHVTIEEYRSDVLTSETEGPEFVKFPPKFYEWDGLKKAEILIVQFCPVASNLIEYAKNLKLIGINRVGVENINLSAAKIRKIKAINTYGRNAQAVAEFSVGMLLAELRDIARSHLEMKKQNWIIDYPGTSRRFEISNKTIGIIGAGKVGRRTAEILQGFNAKVLMYDPHTNNFPPNSKSVDLETLLQEADHVILHARLMSKDQLPILGEKEFKLMKKDAVLVNTARARLVDEGALVNALKNKEIAGAALDVYHNEPLPTNHPFFSFPNVTLTPHIAGVTEEAWTNGPKMMSEFIRKFVTGEGDDLPYID